MQILHPFAGSIKQYADDCRRKVIMSYLRKVEMSY
jgi:hypothetical protein